MQHSKNLKKFPSASIPSNLVKNRLHSFFIQLNITLKFICQFCGNCIITFETQWSDMQ